MEEVYLTGQQFAGKSYTLNHLTRSAIKILGARCNDGDDGCWMTVNEHADCLYVVVDFEELGSFQWTKQFDTMLSMLNSVGSTAIILNTQKRLEKTCSSR